MRDELSHHVFSPTQFQILLLGGNPGSGSEGSKAVIMLARWSYGDTFQGGKSIKGRLSSALGTVLLPQGVGRMKAPLDNGQ